MSFLRSRALRSAQATFARVTPRVTAPRAQLVAKRFASSGHGAHAPSSDLPWLISALVITPVSCYYLWPESSHADSGHHGHAAHAEDEEHKEEEKEEPEEKYEAPAAEEPAAEEPAEKEEKEDKPAEEAPKEESEEKSEEAKEPESTDADSEEPKSDSSDKKSVSSANAKVHPDSPGAKTTRKVEPGNKGGNKIRIDSGLGKNLGEGINSDQPYNDSPGAPNSSSVAKKQAGLSNTDTRHSTQPEAPDSGISTKGHGGPETAKHKGTVDPSAPVK